MKDNLLIFVVLLMFVVNMGYLFYREPSTDIPLTPPPIHLEEDSSDIKLSPLPERKEIIPEFVGVKEYRKVNEKGSVYADVLSHSRQSPFGDGHGRATNVHETAHGIHSEIRNEYMKDGKRVNGFYCLEGRGVVIEEPRVKMSDIHGIVPQNLRSYRWDLYMNKQLRDWNDTPLYIFDEWNAYVLGGMCCVDDVKNGRYRGGWTDGVSGCLDFSIYAIALGMAVKEKDKAYWDSNEQFRNFLIWNLRRAQETYLIGSKMKEFQWEKQDKLYDEFMKSSSGEKIRQFIKNNLENVWLDNS